MTTRTPTRSAVRVTAAALALGFAASLLPVEAGAAVAPAADLETMSTAATRPSDGTEEMARRGRGADDGAGHRAGDDRSQRGKKKGGKGRGRGADDAPNHG